MSKLWQLVGRYAPHQEFFGSVFGAQWDESWGLYWDRRCTYWTFPLRRWLCYKNFNNLETNYSQTRIYWYNFFSSLNNKNPFLKFYPLFTKPCILFNILFIIYIIVQNYFYDLKELVNYYLFNYVCFFFYFFFKS